MQFCCALHNYRRRTNCRQRHFSGYPMNKVGTVFWLCPTLFSPSSIRLTLFSLVLIFFVIARAHCERICPSCLYNNFHPSCNEARKKNERQKKSSLCTNDGKCRIGRNKAENHFLFSLFPLEKVESKYRIQWMDSYANVVECGEKKKNGNKRQWKSA